MIFNCSIQEFKDYIIIITLSEAKPLNTTRITSIVFHQKGATAPSETSGLPEFINHLSSEFHWNSYERNYIIDLFSNKTLCQGLHRVFNKVL
jgi:hypothetical protein